MDLHKGAGAGRPRLMAAAAAVAKSDARYMAQQRAALWVDVMGVGLNAVWPGHHAQLGLPGSFCPSPAVSCLSLSLSPLSLPPLFTSLYYLFSSFPSHWISSVYLCLHSSLALLWRAGPGLIN